MAAILTEIKAFRLSVEDMRWLKQRAATEDRTQGFLLRKLVEKARLADVETTMQPQERDDD